VQSYCLVRNMPSVRTGRTVAPLCLLCHGFWLVNIRLVWLCRRE
jgi:hypothetical protein